MTEQPPDAVHDQGVADGSFEDFVDREYGRLYSALCLMARDRTEAQDVTQDAFLGVWERWERVRAMDSPVGYLYRTALNLYRKRLRRAAVALRRSIGLGRPRDELAEVEDRDVIVRALRALTPRQRESVVLTDLLGYSSDDAAQLMGIKAPTVRALATQARAAVRQTALTSMGDRDG
jgi:RNA polymerase sigma factor (sigma-70 family)